MRFQHRRDKELEDTEEVPDDVGYVRCPLPRRNDGELFGLAVQLLGASKIKLMCADGKSRLGRIPGKIKKRMWIREGDFVILKPWSFQDEKADVIYRYTKTQSTYLSRKRMLPRVLETPAPGS